MTKKLYLPLLMALVVALSSCSSKMGELSSDYFTVTPQVLEAIGGKVPATINGKFPEKYFNKKAVVEVTPVLSFDERGHQKNNTTYFVYGSDENGEKPESFYPTVEEFIGEGGTFLNPEAVRINKPGKPSGTELQGKEAVGGIRFSRKTLKPRETAGYILLCGIADAGEQQFPRKENTDKKAIDPAKASKWIESLTSGCRTRSQVRNMLEEVKEHWIRKVNVAFETGSEDADNYLKWICFQPILRRIYGCSFLPYHDYGKGGRGWRDLWQDCLALLIMEPSEVRQMIIDNYGGVRIDGTNATIIGSGQGEFIADRNNITRVWMDHSFWPFVTTKLYLDQTGDLDVLFEKIPYFKDLQSKRGTAHDEEWNSSYGNLQKTYVSRVAWCLSKPANRSLAHFLMWEIIMKCVCMEQTGMMP